PHPDLNKHHQHPTKFISQATPTTDIYPLSLHDALPISAPRRGITAARPDRCRVRQERRGLGTARKYRPAPRYRSKLSSGRSGARSEEHTSELQSRGHLVCRLLLEKKKRMLMVRGQLRTQ